MAISTDLKQLRLQVEKLQVEVDGRRSIGSRVVWDQQNESSVNEEFSGLVVHLSEENHTTGISQNEFETLKQQILDALPE